MKLGKILSLVAAIFVLILSANPASAQIVRSGNTTVDMATAQRINPLPVGPGILETDQERLSNPGFESGSLIPWSTSAWTISTNGPHAGTYCAYDVGNNYIMQYITPTLASQITSVTLWERQPSAEITAVDFLYQNGTYSENVINITSTWTQYNVTSFIQAGQTVIAIRFWGYSGPGTQESFIDDISVQTSSSQPTISVYLTPINPPITVPGSGGSFTFYASALRSLGPQASFSVWARIKNPNGTYTAPTLGPVAINPPINVNVSRTRTQNVPASWAAGTYTYLAYGNTTFTYPAIDSSSFTWTKSADLGNGPYVWDASCTGEPFPGEQAISNPPTVNGTSIGTSPFPKEDETDVVDTLWWTGNIDQHIVGGQTISWTTDLPQIQQTRLKIKYGLWNSPNVNLDIYVNNHFVATVVANQGYISPGPVYAQFGIGNYIVAGPDLIEVRAQAGGGEAVVGFVGCGYKPSANALAGTDPVSLSLSPNPFNPTTTISFTLPEVMPVKLNVFDVSGRLVTTLVNGTREAGQHQVTFDGSNLASGVYLYTLSAGSQTATGKMVLMK